MQKIKDELNLNPNARIELLIGGNCSKVVEIERMRHREGDGAYSLKKMAYNLLVYMKTEILLMEKYIATKLQ